MKDLDKRNLITEQPDQQLPRSSAQLYEAYSSPNPAIQADAHKELWERYLYPIASWIVQDLPEPHAVAQDSAQEALVQIYRSFGQCRSPESFIGWAKQIARNKAIDQIRSQSRLMLFDGEREDDVPHTVSDDSPGPDAVVLTTMTTAELRELIIRIPVISSRSRRVIIGRYFDNKRDEELALEESELGDRTVRPSHIQVTRSKNFRKIRDWPDFSAFR